MYIKGKTAALTLLHQQSGDANTNFAKYSTSTTTITQISINLRFLIEKPLKTWPSNQIHE